MILSIKIKDDIWVSTRNSNVKLSKNFEESQNSVKTVCKIDYEKDKIFDEFISIISNNFKPSVVYNLYHFADAFKVAEIIINDYKSKAKKYNYTSSAVGQESGLEIETDLIGTNLLNNFCFSISDYPNEIQIGVLNDLKSRKIIDYYWIEGEIKKTIVDKKVGDNYNVQNKVKILPSQVNINQAQIVGDPFIFDVQNPLQIPASNNYIANELGIKLEKNRGAGATIICVEEYAILDLSNWKNKYIGSLWAKSFGGIDNTFDETKNHQLETLVTLFAKIPLGDTNKINQPEGIIPEANLVITSLGSKSESPNFTMKMTEMEKLRDFLLNISLELTKGNFRKSILLFEFSVEIQLRDNPLEHFFYPLTIDPEINRILNSRTLKNNIIAVTGSGNAAVNFDDRNKNIWGSDMSYTDLSINNPGLIVVGDATKNDDVFEIIYNKSDSLDAYIYTEIGITLMNNQIGSFRGTSASAAIAAGIITFLQGKALSSSQGKKSLTTQMIKNVFKGTFMKNYPNKILTQTTLRKLWSKCQAELKTSQHQ